MALIFVGLLLVSLMIVAAFVVDLGQARQQKRQAVSAADAGALAGAQALASSGAMVPAACADASCVAAYHTLASSNLTPSDVAAFAAARGACTIEAVVAGETCFQYAVGRATVAVKNPYSRGGAPADLSAVHVRICWDSPTSFARVIGVNTINLCGLATAENTGPIGGGAGGGQVVKDCGDENNFETGLEPATSSTLYTFDPGDYPDEGKAITFSKGNKTPKNKEILVALYNGAGPSANGLANVVPTDIDLTSIVFTAPTTLSGPNGQVVKLPRIVPKDNHGPEASNATGIGYVLQTLDATGKVQPYKTVAQGGTGKVLIAYQLPDDSHLKVNGKNFVYTATLHVNDSENTATPPTRCGNGDWTFTHDGKNLTSSGSTCGENSFFGFPPEPTNGKAVPGTPVRAFYVDESLIQAKDYGDASWPADPTLNFGIDFSFTEVGTGITTRIPKSTNFGADGGYWIYNSDGAHSSDKFNSTIQWNVPSTMNNTTYKIYLKAYDTDNNKPGNDCGVFTWDITVSGAKGGTINLTE